jgi:uncharacterized protein
MQTLESILTTLREHKSDLQERYGIRNLAVFGSYARGEQTPESDIDIMVELGDVQLGMEYFQLVYDLRDLFSQRVDVVSRGALKPRQFDHIQNDLQYI